MQLASTNTLTELADLIREVGNDLDEIGELVETTKWGQQSFLPSRPRVGTTIRIDQPDEASVALYVHCQTSLVDTFRTLFPELDYLGERGIRFRANEPLPGEEIRVCVTAALLYHWNKKHRQID